MIKTLAVLLIAVMGLMSLLVASFEENEIKKEIWWSRTQISVIAILLYAALSN